MSNRKSVKTWQAQIYVGLKEGYDGIEHSILDVEHICQEVTDEIGWCVTVTPTTFVYKNGKECGAVIGIIQYPRFPLDIDMLRNQTLALAEFLKLRLKQIRVSVILPEETWLLETEGI